MAAAETSLLPRTDLLSAADSLVEPLDRNSGGIRIKRIIVIHEGRL